MFDSNQYRKDVLKALLVAEQPLADPFLVFGLDPSTDDDELIRTRIDDVVAFWRKEQSSPRYKGIVTRLLDERGPLVEVLLDERARAGARAGVVAASTAGTEARLAELDDLLTKLDRRLGGIPASRLDRLHAAARRLGVTEEDLAVRLADFQILDDQTATAEPLPPAVRERVRALLLELDGLAEGARISLRTLFDLLGVGPDAPAAELREAADAIGARNRRRRHDRARTVTDGFLALAVEHLIEGDRGRYLAGIEEDLAEELRPQVETALLIEDRITPVEFERLLRHAIGAGLDPTRARAIVGRVATALGAPIETGAVVDYVVCASCAAVAPSDTAASACASCGDELHRDCPQCGRRSPRTAARCPGCSFDLRALADAEADLARRLAEARALPEPEQEVALVAMVDGTPASEAVLEALRALPVAPPSRVVAMVGDAAINLSWKPSRSSGPISYRVSRATERPGSAELSQTVGSTFDPGMEDGGAAAGARVAYEVHAVRHGVRSEPVRTKPVLAAFEVPRLVAVDHDGAVELQWPRLPSEPTVWVERTDLADPATPPVRLRAGATGLMDTRVAADHRYEYRVVVEYDDGGTLRRTAGRTIEVSTGH